MAKRVVVVGAGTEIGKTHVASLLLHALRKAGKKWRGVKPVESGIAPGMLHTGSDAARLAKAGRTQLARPRYLFVEPVSPHVAARRSHIDIELDEIDRWVGGFGEHNLVVETAGGLMSPLGPSLTNLDLAERLMPDGLLVVAEDRLGVLHDVASLMLLLKPRFQLLLEAEAVLVALNTPEKPDASTGTNNAELRALGIASAVLTIPRSSIGAPEAKPVSDTMVEFCESLSPGTLRGIGLTDDHHS